MSVDYAKLKTNLNLIMHRLKLVEKKKMELNQKARRTIGEFLNAGKVDRARIRVEQIIREDYIIESMDLVESYCDFILSRFGQLQSSEVVDEGLATAVSSLIWVTPRFENDVPELKVIADQLGRKYGKQYIQAAKENTMNTVNETLIKKMSVQAPPRLLVEKYLVEIAKDQKIDYKPDPHVLKEQEALNSSGFRPSSDADDEAQRRRQPSEQAPAGGFNLIDLGDHYPRNPITQTFNPYDNPPPLPSEPPLGPVPVGPSQSGSDVTDASAPSASLPIGFNLPNMLNSSSSSRSSTSQQVEKSSVSPLKQGNGSGKSPQSNTGEGPPPNYESVVNKPSGGSSTNENNTQYFSFGPDSSFGPGNRTNQQDDMNDTLPELPPVPKESHEEPSNPSPDERLDFEDLSRRFEELKSKKP